MAKENPIRAGVVTVSDKASAGERKDASGPLLADLLRKIGVQVVAQTVVPDEQGEIRRVLTDLADEAGVDLVVTTGGTGLTPRDVTPEATKGLIEREVPGLAEVLRFDGYRKTPLAVLSRGVAGIRGGTLILNLPGSPKAVREGMETLMPILPHAIRMLRGVDTEHFPEKQLA
jgi:molybdopterin adenylyltransferase